MKLKRLALVSLALMVLGWAVPGRAVADDDLGKLKTQIAILQAQVDKLQADQSKVVHQQEMKQLLGEMLQDAKTAPAMPKWMENLKFYGDLRLRYQNDCRGPVRNAAGGSSSSKSRNRLRTRLRFGITKTWWDKQLEVGFRLSTGTDGDSGNQTWGEGANDEFGTNASPWGKYYIGVDLAYAKYAPKWAKGLSVTGGKMKNPFRTKTKMTWDSDINPEGIVIDYAPKLAGGKITPFAQVGYWMLEENEGYLGGNNADVTMWSFSGGLDWKIAKDVKWFMGSTFYLYENIDSWQNATDVWWTNATPTTYRNEYKLLELTTSLKWKMFNLPFKAYFSWVHNCADNYNYLYTTSNQGNGDNGSGFQDQCNAYGVGLKVGQNKKKGDWSAGVDYLYIEQQAVPAFAGGFGLSDSDFGGPNRKGFIIGGQYNIDDFLTIGGKVFITDAIHDGWANPTASNVTTQIDLVWKF